MDIEQVRAIADELNRRTPERFKRFCRVGRKVLLFTGWKTNLISPYKSAAAMAEELEPIRSPEQVTFVGQWLWHGDNEKENFYVNLPGMEKGMFTSGEAFEIGVERVNLFTPIEELERLLDNGLDELVALLHWKE